MLVVREVIRIIKSGVWVSKGNPTGYVDSYDGVIVDQMGRDWMERRMKWMTADDWKGVTQSWWK